MTTPDTQEKCPQCGSDKLLAKYRTEYLCKSWNYGDAYNEFVQSDLCKERQQRIKAEGELANQIKYKDSFNDLEERYYDILDEYSEYQQGVFALMEENKSVRRLFESALGEWGRYAITFKDMESTEKTFNMLSEIRKEYEQLTKK